MLRGARASESGRSLFDSFSGNYQALDPVTRFDSDEHSSLQNRSLEDGSSNTCSCTNCVRYIDRSLDVLINLFFVTPISLAIWASSWPLIQDIILKDYSSEDKSWVAFAIGVSLRIATSLLLPILERFVPRKCSITFVIVSRIIIYIGTFTTCCLWVGVWGLYDTYIHNDTYSAPLCLFLSFLFLIFVRGICNLKSAPFGLSIDVDEDFYKVFGRFRITTERKVLFVLDIVFTFIMELAGILTWRTTWLLMEKHFNLNSSQNTEYLCVAVGIGCSLLIFTLEPLTIKASQKIYAVSWYAGLVFEDSINFITFLVSVTLWRGGWGIILSELIKGQIFNIAMYHAWSIIVLILFQVGSSMLITKCSVDGEDHTGLGLYNRIDYISFWRNLCEKRRNQQAQALRDPSGPHHEYSINRDERSPLLDNAYVGYAGTAEY